MNKESINLVRLSKAKILQNKIKTLRDEGKSMRFISNRLGVSLGTVSNYVNNKIPKFRRKVRVKTIKSSAPLSEKDREYNRDRQYKYRYGITLNDYLKLYNKQKGRCKICLEKRPSSGSGKLYIDHCHKTNKVRGLLCPKCNTTLGRVNDNIELLKRAITYLKS